MGFLSLAVSALPLAAGFTAAPAQLGCSACSVSRSAAVQCSAAEDGLSRRAVLSTLASAAAAASASPAWAGYITNLGIEPTKPADAEKDDELFATKEVQAALTSLKNYRTSATALKAKFDADQNLTLIPLIRKDFDFSKLRDDLNLATAVFDETTQQTTDRIERRHAAHRLESTCRAAEGG